MKWPNELADISKTFTDLLRCRLDSRAFKADVFLEMPRHFAIASIADPDEWVGWIRIERLMRYADPQLQTRWVWFRSNGNRRDETLDHLFKIVTTDLEDTP